MSLGVPVVNIIVVGATQVGKTQMMMRFARDTFTEGSAPTIGVDKLSKDVVLSGLGHKISIFDTAGQEHFRGITKGYLRKGDGILVVYCVDRQDSFAEIPAWFSLIDKTRDSSVPITLIGNKCDLPAVVSEDEGRRTANEHGVPFLLTSAKDGTNIENAFMELAERASRRRESESVTVRCDEPTGGTPQAKQCC
jgi:small GTP-binding protein